MSPPEVFSDVHTPGHAITLALASEEGIPIAATVEPLTAAQEQVVAEFRSCHPSALPIHLETQLLELGMTELAGHPPTRTALDGLLLGDRNRLILALLNASYGVPQSLLMNCSSSECTAAYEIPLDIASILNTRAQDPAGAVFWLPAADGEVAMRLPTGADIAAIADAGMAAEHLLLERCLIAPCPNAEVRHQLEDAIRSRDPCAELMYVTHCSECGADIEGLLDPLALLLGEMNRLGGVWVELDQLARAYHWSEAELLALPAFRRRRYLQLINEAMASMPVGLAS